MMTTAPQEGTVKVWIIKAGEHNEGLDIAVGDDDDRTPLVFADAKYREAFAAFLKIVEARIGKSRAVYSYPGEIGHMAHAEVVAQGGHGDDYSDYVDVVELRSYDVIGG
jgi:hypothetical protein